MDWQKIRIRLHLTKTKRAFDEGGREHSRMAMSFWIKRSLDLFRHFPSKSARTSLQYGFFFCFLSHSFDQWFSRHISSSLQVTSLAFSIFMCVFLCNLDFEFDNLCDISSDFWAFDICSDRNENEFSTKVCVVCIVWNWCLYVDSLTLYRIVSYNTETGNGRILKQNMLEKEKWRENEMDTSELMKKIIHTQAKHWTWGRILSINVRIHIINFLLNGSFPSSIRCNCYFLFSPSLFVLKGSRRHAVTLDHNRRMFLVCESLNSRLKFSKRLTQACNSSWLCSALLSTKRNTTFLRPK